MTTDAALYFSTAVKLDGVNAFYRRRVMQRCERGEITVHDAAKLLAAAAQRCATETARHGDQLEEILDHAATGSDEDDADRIRRVAKAPRPRRMTPPTTIGPAEPVPKTLTTPYVSAPTAAEHGSVSIQATMMLPATPQRTAESRLAAPAPMIAPDITCVVDSGKPTCEADRITAAPAPGPRSPAPGPS